MKYYDREREKKTLFNIFCLVPGWKWQHCAVNILHSLTAAVDTTEGISNRLVVIQQDYTKEKG